ncbi:hypothetical protein PsYK624_150630 [Phanerochaete sordida]|uniref:Uncharacterized protein n=1 Tax=Phanerochaete sordida TaxID=48140 RepID=A0A9P3GPK4_9APHY|nr:hypothetical protein PsYK624_150630 [Phanerochaete sordida]
MAAILPSRTSKGRSPSRRPSKSTPTHRRIALKARIIRRRPLATHRRARKTVVAATASRSPRAAILTDDEVDANEEEYGDENAEPDTDPHPSRARRCTSLGALRANVAHALAPPQERTPLGDISALFGVLGLDGGDDVEDGEDGEEEEDEEEDEWYDGYAEHAPYTYSDDTEDFEDFDDDDARSDSSRTAASSPTFSEYSATGTAFDPDFPDFPYPPSPTLTLDIDPTARLLAPTPVEAGAVPLGLAAWLRYQEVTGGEVVPWAPRAEYEDGWGVWEGSGEQSDEESDEEEGEEDGGFEGDEVREEVRGPLRVVNGLPDDL